MAQLRGKKQNLATTRTLALFASKLVLYLEPLAAGARDDLGHDSYQVSDFEPIR
jgi:hypothetical protein